MAHSPVLGQGPIAIPGFRFIGIAGALTLLCWLLDFPLLAFLGCLATGFLVYFFRNPERTIPGDPALIVAPADGKVIRVDEGQSHELLPGPATRVAIFMNVFDVHVNRAPVAGRVLRTRHQPGRFLAAFKDEAVTANEQFATLWETPDGRQVLTVQIAGLLARRIVPAVKEGDRLDKGAPFGMICFGSRVDLYLPPQCDIMVNTGDRVKAGESPVARWSG
uniref:Phosphatidylserine decarboxylase proenzyme n=1 Tax=Desulfobacca acetoxidans TaxID=60893 RepID=A0A7V4G8B1_9BACT